MEFAIRKMTNVSMNWMILTSILLSIVFLLGCFSTGGGGKSAEDTTSQDKKDTASQDKEDAPSQDKEEKGSPNKKEFYHYEADWKVLEPTENGFDEDNLAVYEIVADNEPEALQRAHDLAARKESLAGLEWFSDQGLAVKKSLSEQMIARQRVQLAGKYEIERIGRMTLKNSDNGTIQIRYRVEVRRKINESDRNKIVASVVNEDPSGFLKEYEPLKHADTLNEIMAVANVDPTKMVIYLRIKHKHVIAFITELNKWIEKVLRIVEPPAIKKNLTDIERAGLPDSSTSEDVSVDLEVRLLITRGEKRPDLFIRDKNGEKGGFRPVEWKKEGRVDSHRTRLVGKVSATMRNPKKKKFTEQNIEFFEALDKTEKNGQRARFFVFRLEKPFKSLGLFLVDKEAQESEHNLGLAARDAGHQLDDRLPEMVLPQRVGCR